jgi:ATP-dependent DNA helicase RecQ
MAKQWTMLAHQFVRQGLLIRDMDHGSLQLTQKADAVLFRGQQVLGLAPEEETAPGKARPEVAEYDQALFDTLRARRKELADAAGVPPYIIFSDRSLADMAAYFPQADEAFYTMYGVGRGKMEKYADHFLPLIRAYCRENDLAERPKPGSDKKRARAETLAGGDGFAGLGERSLQVGLAYQSGASVATLATQWNVKTNTILAHLSKFVRAGHDIPAGDLLELSALPAAKRDQVLVAFEEHGPEYLRPVFDALGGTVSYDELHLLRLYYIASQAGREEQVHG